MKSKSITRKLFLITALLLFVFLTSTLAFQTAFFEKFYINRKTSHLKSNLGKFVLSYSNQQDDLKVISMGMYSFSDENNCEVLISRKQNNGYLIMSTLNFDMEAPPPITSAKGDTIKIQTMAEDPIKKKIILQALENWSAQLTSKANAGGRKILTAIYEHPYENSNYVVLVSPGSGKAADDVIIAVSSLQPIGEAANVIKEFYIYIFAAAALLIVIFSLIYTNMIAKPLVELNRTADRMLDLDFTARCNVEAQDEIGSLGNTLNFLSSKLNTTLSDLKSANAKLQRDIDKERALEKLRKEFIADVSHELKTPISLIKGYAEGLKDDIADEADREYYIDVIIDESDKMGYLVGDMLNLSQLESGKTRLDMESFNIVETASQLIRKYSNSFTQKQITVKTVTGDECLEVYADKRKIEQVVTNFISNAIRYTPENGVITLSICDLGENIFFGIENTGEPIEENEMPKLWDKFYRVEKSRNKQLGGTGLGLAIVKNILEAHGFKYGVKNTKSGVLFYFELVKVKTEKNC